MSKFWILCSSVILALSVATFVVAESQGPPEVKYTPKMGTVTFQHAAHQSYTDCATCHHTGDFAQCKSCHGVDPQAPQAKDAFHQLCKDCHKESQKGPTKCKECHIK
ncbi:MAG: cytochrome c3 family protein [Desulfuromonadales bacterium]|nr:cytochrome c3 family protein [Desulfuromonadales bacterium]MBN2793410.1 cytochrome c3 family protein [Desulfuromonadales bacterium]